MAHVEGCSRYVREAALVGGKLRPHDRTDGRRKGYREYKSSVQERMRVTPEVRKKLEAMRESERKNTDRKAR